ncbi:MAG: DUF4340 domain-containing protein [Clostridia bacterium]|nr:DUF4340 domain-containing protein [Clostridia bacterium]
MTKQKKLALIALCLAVVLAVLYFAVFSPMLKKLNEKEEPKKPIELMDGEAYYVFGGKERVDMGVIYPQVSYDQIFSITVHPKNNENYMFFHMLEGSKDYLALGSLDENCDPHSFLPYSPEITDIVYGFDKTTLYDGRGKVPALLTAVGGVVFNERAYVKPQGTTYEDLEKALHRYGLAEADEAPWVEVTTYLFGVHGEILYTEGEELYCYNPEDKLYYLYDKDTLIVTETGYDFTNAIAFVGDPLTLTPAPDTVGARRLYVGRSLPSGDGYYVRLEGRDIVYVVGSVHTDVAQIDLSNIVDKNMTYYVEPNLMIPPTTLYDPFLVPHFGMETGSLKDKAGTPLVVGDTVYLSDKDGKMLSHVLQGNKANLFQLILAQKQVGQSGVWLPTNEALFCLLPDGGVVDYTITEILGISGPQSGYTTWDAVAVEEESLLRVRYTASDGVSHTALLYMTNSALPQTLKADLLGCGVGEVNITCSMLYDTPDVSYTLVRINMIMRDGGFAFDEAKEGDLVSFTYRLGNTTTESTMDLVLDTKHESKIYATVSSVLIGKKALIDLNTPLSFEKDALFSKDAFLEDLTISCAVSYQTNLSFSYYYYGDGKRDPFLIDSIYQTTGPSSLVDYTIDSATAQAVLEVFAEWKGTHTVAVGITPEVMLKYGLFARRMSISMTYNTKADDLGGGNLTNITCDHRIDYTFYVSEEQDGYRYVASPLYDVVVQVPSEPLEFLDWNFLDKWARSNLLLMYLRDIREIEVISRYTDRQSHHSFWLSTDHAYKYQSQGEVSTIERLYVMYVSGKTTIASSNYSKDFVTAKPGVAVDPIGDMYRVTHLQGGVDLDKIYYDQGHTGSSREDLMGVYFFRRMMTVVLSTRYIGEVADDLSPQEITALMANPQACVTSMKVKLVDGRSFGYDFYAYSAERMLVSFTTYRTDGSVESQSQVFYVNASEVKKIVTFCDKLSSGDTFHADDFY